MRRRNYTALEKSNTFNYNLPQYATINAPQYAPIRHNMPENATIEPMLRWVTYGISK